MEDKLPTDIYTYNRQSVKYIYIYEKIIEKTVGYVEYSSYLYCVDEVINVKHKKVMKNQMHIERVSKLTLTQINSILTEISEEWGIFNRQTLVDSLLKGWLADCDNNEWEAKVESSTKWFEGNWKWFETKKEALEIIKK